MSRVGLDIDGVLYPFTDLFHVFSEGYLNTGLETPTTWRFYAEQWRIDDTAFNAIHESFVDGDGYQYGPLIGGGKTLDALYALKDAGHDIILLTARGASCEGQQKREIQAQTRAWLADQEIPYDHLYHLADKTIIDVDYMLDDNIDNWAAMTDAGVDTWLYTQPWNRTCEGLRVPTVAHYVNYVLATEKEKQAVPATVEFLGEVPADPWGNERDDVLARFAHELGKATGDGSKKRQAGEKPPWYLDGSHEAALFSHLNKWKHGEKVDPDSGAHTLVHLAWRALALACQESGNTPDPMGKELAA